MALLEKLSQYAVQVQFASGLAGHTDETLIVWYPHSSSVIAHGGDAEAVFSEALRRIEEMNDAENERR